MTLPAPEDYEIAGADVVDAYDAMTDAAQNAGIGDGQIKEQIRHLIDHSPANGEFVLKSLARQLAR